MEWHVNGNKYLHSERSYSGGSVNTEMNIDWLIPKQIQYCLPAHGEKGILIPFHHLMTSNLILSRFPLLQIFWI
jgi:hypothetical protein